MKLPYFAECHHPIIQPLLRYRDQDLLELFQQHRDQGQYFVALFCRYGQLVYTLLKNYARSPIQTHYLFAKTWQFIFQELCNAEIGPEGIKGFEALSLQTWILNRTAVLMHRDPLPAIETIRYSLEAISPPLWCYLHEALDQLPVASRFSVVMTQTFGWDETNLASYLQSEGEAMSPAEVGVKLQEGYQLLEATLPEDIQKIYLDRPQLLPSS